MNTPLLPPLDVVKKNECSLHIKCRNKLDIFIKQLLANVDEKLGSGDYSTFMTKRLFRHDEYGIFISCNIVGYDVIFSEYVFGKNTDEQTHFWHEQKLYLQYLIDCIHAHISKYVEQYNNYYAASSVKSNITVSEDFRDYKIYFTYTQKEEYREKK